MRVTRIEPLTRTKFRIHIDGEEAFVLYKGELKRFGIQEEAEISRDTVERIEKEVLVKRARLRAMHLLEDMDRTEKGLRDKLEQGGYPARVTEDAIAYVRSFGYLDDARFAENFVLSRREGKSRREICALLAARGVDPDVARAALDQYCSGTGEQEAIRRLLRKKGFDPAAADSRSLQKIYGYLARKGFRFDDIRQVIQNDYPDA